MLNGLDPIIIFNFVKNVTAGLNSAPDIPVDNQKVTQISLPVIPIYLSENLTGIFIDTESKNIDIDTAVDSFVLDGGTKTTQRPIASTVKIEMAANKGSLGLALFSALSDLVFPKVTSREYSITYIHGSTIIFGGLLHAFSISQEANTELMKMTLELIRPAEGIKNPLPAVQKLTGATPISGAA